MLRSTSHLSPHGSEPEGEAEQALPRPERLHSHHSATPLSASLSAPDRSEGRSGAEPSSAVPSSRYSPKARAGALHLTSGGRVAGYSPLTPDPDEEAGNSVSAGALSLDRPRASRAGTRLSWEAHADCYKSGPVGVATPPRRPSFHRTPLSSGKLSCSASGELTSRD